LQVAKIVKAEIEPVGYQWFNEGRNFTQVMAKLEKALLRELEEKEEELRKAADALPETEAQAERVAKLRTCAKLSKRCSADDAEGRLTVLAAHERLVAAMLAQGLAAMGSMAAAADDMVELATQLQRETASDYPRALQMLERALRVKQALQPPAPPSEIALIFYRQGCVLFLMARFDEALVQLEEALKIQTHLYGAEHQDVAYSHKKMGHCFWNKGDLENAPFQGKWALEI
jgi:tetratricopeptide (TPR) repeat protein